MKTFLIYRNTEHDYHGKHQSLQTGKYVSMLYGNKEKKKEKAPEERGF